MSTPWYESFRFAHPTTGVKYCKLCLQDAYIDFFDKPDNAGRRPRENEKLSGDTMEKILAYYNETKKPSMSNSTVFGKEHLLGENIKSNTHNLKKLAPAGTDFSAPLRVKQIKDALDDVNKNPAVEMLSGNSELYAPERAILQRAIAAAHEKKIAAKKQDAGLANMEMYLLAAAAKFQSINSLASPLERQLQVRLGGPVFNERKQAVDALSNLRNSLKERRLEKLRNSIVCLAIDSSTRCNRTFWVATLHHAGEAFILRMIPKEDQVEDDEGNVVDQNTFNGERIAALLTECYAELAKYNIFVGAVASDRAPNMVLGIKLSGKLAISCACHAFHHVGQALEAEENVVATGIRVAIDWYKEKKGDHESVNKVQLPRDQRWLDNVRFMTQILKRQQDESVIAKNDQLAAFQQNQISSAVQKLSFLRVAVRLCEGDGATQIETLRALSVVGFETSQQQNRRKFSFVKLSQHQHRQVFDTTIRSVLTPTLLLVAYFCPIDRTGIVHHANHNALRQLFKQWFLMPAILAICAHLKLSSNGVASDFDAWLNRDHVPQDFDRVSLRKYFADLHHNYKDLGQLINFLSKVAASEASAERAFYLLRRTLVPERQQLSDDNVEMFCELSSFGRNYVDQEAIDVDAQNDEGEIFANPDAAINGGPGVVRPSPSSFRQAVEALIFAALENNIQDVINQLCVPSFVDVVSKQCCKDTCKTAILALKDFNDRLKTNYTKQALGQVTAATKAELHKKLVDTGFTVVFCPQCQGVRHSTCSTAVGQAENGFIKTVCTSCSTKPDAKWW